MILFYQRARRLRALAAAGVIAAAAGVTGCSNQIDTSGSKPPQVVTQADYERRIQIIQNNPKMPPNVKGMLIGQIKSQMNGGAAASAGAPGPK
jgi:hypothetical protein